MRVSTSKQEVKEVIESLKNGQNFGNEMADWDGYLNKAKTTGFFRIDLNTKFYDLSDIKQFETLARKIVRATKRGY